MKSIPDLVAGYILRRILHPKERPFDINTALKNPNIPPAIDFDNVEFQEVVSEKYPLQADLYKPKKGEIKGLVIQMPGWGHNRRSSPTLRYMANYLTTEHNLAVLSINSSQPGNTLGILEKNDVLNAICYSQQEIGVKQIGAFGQSAGAHAVALAVAEYHKNKNAPHIPILLDSPHRNVETLVMEDAISSYPREYLPLSRLLSLTKKQDIELSFINKLFPLSRVVALAKEQGIDFSQGDIEKVVSDPKQIPSARFVVHHPDYQNPAYKNAIHLADQHAKKTGKSRDEILFVTNNGKNGHACSAEVDPKGFFKQVVDPFVHEIISHSGKER